MLACAASLAGLVPVAGAQQPVKGDLWEVTLQMQLQLQGVSLPARTQEVCSPQGSGQPGAIPEPEDGECRTYDVRQTGNTVKWKTSCTGKNPMTGAGEMTFQGDDSYEGRMVMEMGGESMTTLMSGVRTGTGNCDVADEGDAQAPEDPESAGSPQN